MFTPNFKSLVEWLSAFNEGESIENIPRQRVKDYQADALKHMLDFTSASNDFYRVKCAESLENGDFTSTAFLTKDELREDFKRIICNPKLAHIHVSTGTTGGKQIYIGHTMDDLYVYDIAPKYPMLLERYNNSTVAVALPYEMSSSGLSFHRNFQFVLNCKVLPVGKGGVYAPPEKTLSFLTTWDAEVLLTSPSYAITLGEAAVAMGMSLHDIGLSQIILTGEGSSPALRKRIEKMWGCPATIFYGSLEAGLLAMECTEQSGFHIAEGHVHMEIIDPDTGSVVAAGQIGEIVVTTLLREGMPIIRYRTGDLGYLEEAACSCGVQIPRLHLRGRVNDEFSVNGNQFSPLYIEDHIMKVQEAGNWYRITVGINEEITLEIEPANDQVDREYLRELLRNKLEFLLNTPCNVNVVDKLSRSAGKEQRIQYLK